MITAIILLILVYLLNWVDYWQTMRAVSAYGLSVEQNPLGRILLENGHAFYVKLIAVPILLILLGIIIKFDRKQIWAAYVLFVGYYFVIVSNFIMLARMNLL